MHKQIVVLGIVVCLAFAVWWYYPALEDMRDTAHRKKKCNVLWPSFKEDQLTVEEAKFFELTASVISVEAVQPEDLPGLFAVDP